MIYDVIRKSDGEKVHEYQGDAPIEWDGLPFSDFDHVERPLINADDSVEGVVIGRVLTKLEYLRRFTSEERITIRQASKQSPLLEDYLAMLELAEEINTGDADTMAAVLMLEQAGLIAPGRAQEILNG